MDLLENPFYILNATTLDTRQRIMELADDRSVEIESDLCLKARSVLMHPKKRLSAEISWLPGLDKNSTDHVLLWLSRPIHAKPSAKTLSALNPLARANLLTCGLKRLINPGYEELIKWIIELSLAYEDIDSTAVQNLVNEDRSVSGFQEVKELTSIEEEINERRRFFNEIIGLSVSGLSEMKYIEAVTNIIDTVTENGDKQGPILTYDLVNSYEVNAQKFITKQTEKIESLIETLINAAESEESDDTLMSIVEDIAKATHKWDLVAQPIQVSTKSRGLDHAASQKVGWLIRKTAVDFNNKYDKISISKQLTNTLQKVFAEVVEIAECVENDNKILNEIYENKERMSEEWRREITYEAEIGSVFKKRLRISPEGIEWKGRICELNSITGVRWGGTRHYVNGIPTGTTYEIFWSDESNCYSVSLNKDDVYSNFIDRFWKAVCVRLITELLEDLRDGKRINFGSNVIDDQGVETVREKVFGRDEKVYCTWSELVIWNDPGVFVIANKDDKKYKASFNYLTDNNIHILEAVIRMLWKKGGDRLSSLLGDSGKTEKRKNEKNQKINVLVIDDSERTAHMLRDSIQKHFGKCIENIFVAGSGGEAIQILNQNNYNISIISTDVSHPGENGIELAERLNEMYPQIKILFFTGNSRNLEDAFQISDNVIAKPCNMDKNSEYMLTFKKLLDEINT